MKRIVFVAAALSSVAGANAQVDTLATQQLQEVVVKGVRADKNAPFAVSEHQEKRTAKVLKDGHGDALHAGSNARCAGLE